MAEEKASPKIDQVVTGVVEHEGLVPNQTPFRITHPSMANWVSMYDDTIRAPLDPNFPKPAGRENFLYVPKGMEANVPVMIKEQLRRYAAARPELTVAEAIKIFDQTGAEGKLKFLEGRIKGFKRSQKLKDLFEVQK